MATRYLQLQHPRRSGKTSATAAASGTARSRTTVSPGTYRAAERASHVCVRPRRSRSASSARDRARRPTAAVRPRSPKAWPPRCSPKPSTATASRPSACWP
jgi:hypothetical protein